MYSIQTEVSVKSMGGIYKIPQPVNVGVTNKATLFPNSRKILYVSFHLTRHIVLTTPAVADMITTQLRLTHFQKQVEE